MGAVTVGAKAPTGSWQGPSITDLGVLHNGKRVRRVILTASASYATGGDTFTPASVGLDRVEAVLLEATEALMPTTTQKIGKGVTFDCSNITAPKMKVYTAVNTEAGNTTDQSAASVAAWVIGL